MAPALPRDADEGANAVRPASEGDTPMPAAARVERLIIEAEIFEPTTAEGREARGARTSEQATAITALAAEWLAAQALAATEEARLDAISSEAYKLYLPHPPAGRYGPFLWHRDQEAANNWWRQAEGVDALAGLPVAEKAWDHAVIAAQLIADKIVAIRPATVSEAALKYGVLIERYGDGQGGFDDPAPVRAFLADLEHLAELERSRAH